MDPGFTGGAPTPKVGCIIGQNCLKMKTIGPMGAGGIPSAPPITSPNVKIIWLGILRQ